MRRIHDCLRPEEQRFAEEHHYLYLAFLNNFGLDEDYYSELMVPYLYIVMRYCRNKKLQRYDFAAILWPNLRSELHRYWKKRAKDPIIVDQEYHPPPEEEPEDYLLWDEMQDILTQKQNETILLRNQGYTNAEIADLCGVTVKAIEKRFCRIRNKLKMKRSI